MKNTRILLSGYSVENKPSIALYEMQENDMPCIWSDYIQSPTFIITYKEFLFTVTETDNESTFYMYKEYKKGYRLVDRYEVSIGGVCHISYLEHQKLLVASSYGEGTLFTISVKKESFGEISNKFVFGTEKRKSRIHCSLSNAQETKLYVTDLGLDCLYEFQIENGIFRKYQCLQLPRGSGPRHLCFGVEESYLFIITEYSDEIFLIECIDEEMKLINTKNNRILDQGAEHIGAAICISDDKQFLYTSTRGQNCIHVYKIEKKIELQEIQSILTNGIWPRHIACIQKERYLLVANQRSGTVTFFHRNKKSGLLESENKRLHFKNVSFVNEI